MVLSSAAQQNENRLASLAMYLKLVPIVNAAFTGTQVTAIASTPVNSFTLNLTADIALETQTSMT